MASDHGLGLLQALEQLEEIWREDAARMRAYNPDAVGARHLEACADAIRKTIEERGPEWIPLGTVRAATGWADGTLRKRFRELAQEQVRGTQTPLARLAPRWELHVSALELIRPKPRAGANLTDADTIQEMARRLAGDE